MRKIFISREIVNKLHARKIFMTDRIPDGIEGRINREYIYPDDCEIGANCGLLGGMRFPKTFGFYSYSFSPLDIFFSIGNYCSIAKGMQLLGVRHPMERFTTSSVTYDTWSPIFKGDFKLKRQLPPQWKNEINVQDDVWIGANVTLKKGITLHTGCVIGANSLVTHDVPPYAVVGGIPAKLIKYRFDSHTIKELLEIKWFEYDINYLDIPPDIYIYDFIKTFKEHKDELPKLKPMKLDNIFEAIFQERKDFYDKKINLLLENGRFQVTKEEMDDKENFNTLLETMYHKNCLKQNQMILNKLCIKDVYKEFLINVFLRLEEDNRLEYFSMKGDSIWLHYVPFINSSQSKILHVPIERSGKTWPSADRENTSVFATYMTLIKKDVFISIEMSATDVTKARELADMVGYEKNNSPGAIIRLKTKRFPYGDGKELNSAVNTALDELCLVGDKLVVALNKMDL